MLVVKADFMGDIAASYLDKNLIGEIHSVFEQVINIVLPNQRLLTLATKNVSKLPGGINLDWEENFKSLPLEMGDTVYLTKGSLVISDLLYVDFTNTVKWLSSPFSVAESADLEEISFNYEELRTLLKNEANLDGLAGLWVNKSNNLIKHFLFPLSEWCEGIRDKNHEKLYLGMEKMIGLGPGLTPSGDDFLLGGLAVLNYWPDHRLKMNLIQKKTQQIADEKTTDISREYLYQASEGHYSWELNCLLFFLVNKKSSKEMLRNQVRKVIEIGCTSGSDILTGVGMTLKAILSAG
ncbi:MAG: DUF2877 domain-containing protein [Bacillota bacterium]|jgi:hypothetical protein